MSLQQFHCSMDGYPCIRASTPFFFSIGITSTCFSLSTNIFRLTIMNNEETYMPECSSTVPLIPHSIGSIGSGFSDGLSDAEDDGVSALSAYSAIVSTPATTTLADSIIGNPIEEVVKEKGEGKICSKSVHVREISNPLQSGILHLLEYFKFLFDGLLNLSFLSLGTIFFVDVYIACALITLLIECAYALTAKNPLKFHEKNALLERSD